jgi:hypothetical protein
MSDTDNETLYAPSPPPPYVYNAASDVDYMNRFVTLLPYNEYNRQFLKRYPTYLQDRLPLDTFHNIVDDFSKKFTILLSPLYNWDLIIIPLLHIIWCLFLLSAIVLTAFFCGPGSKRIWGSTSDPKWRDAKYPTKTWVFFMILPLCIVAFVFSNVFLLPFVFKFFRHRRYRKAGYHMNNFVQQLKTKYANSMGYGISFEFDFSITSGMPEYNSMGILSRWLKFNSATATTTDVDEMVRKARQGTPKLTQYNPILRIVDISGIESTIATFKESHANTKNTVEQEAYAILALCQKYPALKNLGEMDYSYELNKFVDPAVIATATGISQAYQTTLFTNINAAAEVNGYGRLDAEVLSFVDQISTVMRTHVRTAVPIALISRIVTAIWAALCIVLLVLTGVFLVKNKRFNLIFFFSIPFSVITTGLIVLVWNFVFTPSLFRYIFARGHAKVHDMVCDMNFNTLYSKGIECKIQMTMVDKILPFVPVIGNSFTISGHPKLVFQSIPVISKYQTPSQQPSVNSSVPPYPQFDPNFSTTYYGNIL